MSRRDPSLPETLDQAGRQLGADEAHLIDAQLVGLDGDVECSVCLGGETRAVRVRWLPEFDTLEVIEPKDNAWEAFVYSDDETQDHVEQLHSSFVAANRAWRHGWVRADEVEA
jgi:hypothetical protein